MSFKASEITDTRSYNQVTQQDRRLDSLARVLAPDDVYTRCTACAIVNGKLVIAANRPYRKVATPTYLQGIIKTKHNVVIKFLKSDKPIKEVTKQLEQYGGFLSLTGKPEDRSARIEKDLLKLKDSYIKGELVLSEPLILVPGLEECHKLIPNVQKYADIVNQKILEYQRLIKAENQNKIKAFKERKIKLKELNHYYDYWNEVQVKLNKNELIMEEQVHAEQLIVKYAEMNNMDMNFFIGISKLCCAACTEALSNHDAKFRGSHGGLYPTYSLLNDRFITHENSTILMPSSQYPTDSESEPEKERKEMMLETPNDLYSVPDSTIRKAQGAVPFPQFYTKAVSNEENNQIKPEKRNITQVCEPEISETESKRIKVGSSN